MAELITHDNITEKWLSNRDTTDESPSKYIMQHAAIKNDMKHLRGDNGLKEPNKSNNSKKHWQDSVE